MPKYTPREDEMDPSYGAPVTKPKTPAESGGQPPADKLSVDDENAMSDTALVPNKILSPDGEPIKDGDEIVVRVVKNHGTESEVEYAPKKEGAAEEGSEEPETTPGNEDAEIAALDTKGY